MGSSDVGARRHARRADRSAARDPRLHHAVDPRARLPADAARDRRPLRHQVDERRERSPARAREEGLPAARGSEVARAAPGGVRGPDARAEPRRGHGRRPAGRAGRRRRAAAGGRERRGHGARRPLLHRPDARGVRAAGQGRLDDRGRHLRRRLHLRAQAAARQPRRDRGRDDRRRGDGEALLPRGGQHPLPARQRRDAADHRAQARLQEREPHRHRGRRLPQDAGV